jgi:hypothetical protein
MTRRVAMYTDHQVVVVVVVVVVMIIMWAWKISRYSTSVIAERYVDRIPLGGEIFRPCPDRPLDPPSLPYSG